MLYREAGQFKTSYASDQAVFPLLQDRVGIGAILLVAYVAIPLTRNDFLINAIMTPFLIFTLAAIGLNILTGYTGLVSLGTGAFMGVGAYACYKLTTFFPGLHIIVLALLSGFFSAGVGAQFFLSWCFIRVPWLYNNNVSGAIEVPTRTVFGVPVTGATATPLTRYF